MLFSFFDHVEANFYLNLSKMNQRYLSVSTKKLRESESIVLKVLQGIMLWE